MERKINPLIGSKNINFTHLPPPPLGQFCDVGSSSSKPADHSVSRNGTVKADDRKNDCSRGRSSVLTVMQKSGISLVPGTPDQDSSEKNNSRSEKNKIGYLSSNQSSQDSFWFTDDSSHYPKSTETCAQPQSAGTNRKNINSLEKLQSRKPEEIQTPLLNLFSQPVFPVQDRHVDVFD